MNVDAARALLKAQRLLLDAQAALSEYEPTPAMVAITDDLLREAMAAIGNARNELREPAPQPSPDTF